MTHRYTVSGTGYILDNGEVLERQSLRTPQDAVAELLNKQSERIADLEAALEHLNEVSFEIEMNYVKELEKNTSNPVTYPRLTTHPSLAKKAIPDES